MIRRTLLPGWDRFERLFDFRQLIEPLIARTAAERRTDEDAARIRVTLDAYRDAGTDREASRAADEALHAAIAHATQNPYLENLSATDPERDQPGIRRRAVQRADPRTRDRAPRDAR